MVKCWKYIDFNLHTLHLIGLDEALESLRKFDEMQAKVVELGFFGGLTIEETAHALGISPATVKREWTAAKAWLYQRLKGKVWVVKAKKYQIRQFPKAGKR